jgi:hypothetical protein
VPEQQLNQMQSRTPRGKNGLKISGKLLFSSVCGICFEPFLKISDFGSNI